MAEIAFYTNPMSRGQIVRWMLEELGEPYDEHLVGYGPEMKAPAYLAINPMGKVPAIVHNGKTVTECAAICAYLAAVFPEKELGPKPGEEADYFRYLFFAAGPVEQAVTSKTLGIAPTGDQQASAGFGSYELTMNVLDQMFQGRDFVCGDRFTAADVYCGAQVLWGLQFGTVTKTPALEAYAGRLAARPAAQKAKARDDELMAAQQR